MKKRILAALLALGCALLVFTGCGSKKDTTPKDYTQIIHDAREAEDNDYYMIFSPAEDGSSPPSTATAPAIRRMT